MEVYDVSTLAYSHTYDFLFSIILFQKRIITLDEPSDFLSVMGFNNTINERRIKVGVCKTKTVLY